MGLSLMADTAHSPSLTKRMSILPKEEPRLIVKRILQNPVPRSDLFIYNFLQVMINQI